jgi:hypothetical protein
MELVIITHSPCSFLISATAANMFLVKFVILSCYYMFSLLSFPRERKQAYERSCYLCVPFELLNQLCDFHETCMNVLPFEAIRMF